MNIEGWGKSDALVERNHESCTARPTSAVVTSTTTTIVVRTIREALDQAGLSNTLEKTQTRMPYKKIDAAAPITNGPMKLAA